MAYLITISLYASIEYVMLGMIASFFLGVIQLLLGILLLFNYDSLCNSHQKYLKTYWTMVILNVATILIVTKIGFNDFYGIIIVQIIPMLIASYFIFLTYQIQKS